MTKIFIPISGQYQEVTEEEARDIKENLTQQGVISWIVTLNNK